MAERGLYEREDLTAHAEQALESLVRGLESGATDPGSVLLFSGEAGIGKTSLLAEFRRSAVAAGCTVLSARGGEQQKNLPFHVVRQLMQPALARLTPAQRRDLEEASASWYPIAAPAMGAVAPTPGTLSDPQGVRDALDFVVTRLAFQQRPLVIVVDDLHWADEESLTWIAAYAARVPVLPMLLVLAFRPEQMPSAGDPLFGERVSSAGSPQELRPLSPAAVEALVAREFGEGVAHPMFVRECWHVTAGNPYELVTLLTRLKDRKLPPNESTIPEMRDLVASSQGPAIVRRLEKLGTDTHWYAYAAAILDTRIDPDVAGRVAGLSPSVAKTARARLIEDRILREEQDEYGRTVLEFVHPTIATAIYNSVLLPSIRTAMHGQAAVEVVNSGRSLAEASRHLLEVQPEEDLRIVAQLRQAAREHLSIGAPDAAKRCLERALREPPADEDRAELLFELGCSTLLTAPPVTINHLRSALTTVPGLSPEHREQAVLRLGQALGHSNQMEEAARVTLEEIARMRPGLGRTRLEAASFMWRTFLWDEPNAHERAKELAALSDSLSGNDSGARAIRVLRAFDLTQRGERTSEALELASHAFDRGRLADGLGWTNTVWGFEIPVLLGLTYIYNDRLDLAAELFDDAANEYVVAGWSGGHLAFANFMRGLVAFRWGRLVDAEEMLRDALEKSDRLGRNTPLQWDVVGVLCDTLLARGRTAEALALAEKYSFQPPFPSVIVLPDAPTMYGRLLLAAGRREEGENWLVRAGEQLATRGWYNTVWAPWAGALAESLADREPERARALTDQALARAQRIGTNSAVGTALRWCAAAVEPERAAVLLEEAVRRLGQSPAAYEHALSLVDQGAALRRIGRPGEAAEALEQGIELAVQCGADGLVERGRNELLATGGVRRRLRRVAARALNQQEYEAAVRVARGVPLQRIAEELGIGEPEAGRLLASAYRKVGTGPEGLATALGLDQDPEQDADEG